MNSKEDKLARQGQEELEAIENITPEEWARLEGETSGREFREKEIEYDRRGGRHEELTDARACVYRLMICLAQFERLTELRAPEGILAQTKRRLERFVPYMTPEAYCLLEDNYPRFQRDYLQHGGLLMTDTWAKRFGVLPDPSMN